MEHRGIRGISEAAIVLLRCGNVDGDKEVRCFFGENGSDHLGETESLKMNGKDSCGW